MNDQHETFHPNCNCVASQSFTPLKVKVWLHFQFINFERLFICWWFKVRRKIFTRSLCETGNKGLLIFFTQILADQSNFAKKFCSFTIWWRNNPQLKDLSKQLKKGFCDISLFKFSSRWPGSRILCPLSDWKTHRFFWGGAQNKAGRTEVYSDRFAIPQL